MSEEVKREICAVEIQPIPPRLGPHDERRSRRQKHGSTRDTPQTAYVGPKVGDDGDDGEVGSPRLLERLDESLSVLPVAIVGIIAGYTNSRQDRLEVAERSSTQCLAICGLVIAGSLFLALFLAGTIVLIPKYQSQPNILPVVCQLLNHTLLENRCCDKASYCWEVGLNATNCDILTGNLTEGICDNGPLCCAQICDTCRSCAKANMCNEYKCNCRCEQQVQKAVGVVRCGVCHQVIEDYFYANQTVSMARRFGMNETVPTDALDPPNSRQCYIVDGSLRLEAPEWLTDPLLALLFISVIVCSFTLAWFALFLRKLCK